MSLTKENLKEIAQGSESYLRGKIDDSEVDKVVNAIHRSGGASDGSSLATSNVLGGETITGVTGAVICAIFYWRITLDTPNGNHHYTGNAGGLGSVGGGGIQGGALTGYPDLNTLYAKAHSFQFNSAAIALNVNFFDEDHSSVAAWAFAWASAADRDRGRADAHLVGYHPVEATLSAGKIADP